LGGSASRLCLPMAYNGILPPPLITAPCARETGAYAGFQRASGPLAGIQGAEPLGHVPPSQLLAAATAALAPAMAAMVAICWLTIMPRVPVMAAVPVMVSAE